MIHRSDESVSAVQVSFHLDEQRRSGAELLDAWPALTRGAAAAARAGVRVDVVQSAYADETLERDGVNYHFVNDDARKRRRVVGRACAFGASVVHVLGIHHGAAIRTLIDAAAAGSVLVQDRGAVTPTGLQRAAWRWALANVGGAVFTSRDQAGPWIECGVFRRALPIFEVHGGSSEFTTAEQAGARRATGMGGDPCLLWTGRLDENKDPMTMLAAVEHAAVELPELRLWCCYGKAPMLDSVQARIASSPVLAPRTTLLGTRPPGEMEMIFRSADFYLQTSHREASGFSMLEALACGTTPLSTDIPAARRMIGDAGSLTPVGDDRALGDAIVAWARRDRAVLRCNARVRFDEALSWDVVGRELTGAYAMLAAR